MSMEMPMVKDCTVTNCAFNARWTCHALAITVGAESEPLCDTFISQAGPAGDPEAMAGVGACRMYMCLHNRNLECIASTIRVGLRHGHPDCLTFKNRYKEGTT